MKPQETTSIYTWPAATPALIDFVECVHQKNGHVVAYLHAKEDASQQPRRQELRNALRLKGWGTLSDFREGRHVLRVSGVESDASLLATLRYYGVTQGDPAVKTQASEHEDPHGVLDAVRTGSLRFVGMLYSLGNAIYLAAGLHRSKLAGKIDYGQIGTGLAFGSGDLLIATIGGRDDGRQLTNLLTQLKRHYDKTGVDVPVAAAIHTETSDKGKSLGTKLYDFAYRHLNQIKCLAEVVGGIFYYRAGVQQNSVWKRRTAMIFGPGFLASALIPEKKLDEEKYAAAGPLGRLWMRIQANPLSIGGLSGYSNTVFTSISAYQERKAQLALGPAGNKAYRWDFAAPVVMGVANGMYAVTQKTTGGDIRTDAMIQDVYSVASQILNKLPTDKRKAGIESTIQFLAERPEIKGSRDDIRLKLHETMERQRQNPWFEPLAVPPRHPELLKPAAPAPEASTATPPAQVKDATPLGKGLSGPEATNDAQYSLTANGRA